MIEANVKNLTSFWKTASVPFQSFYKTPVFDYCEIEDSDWPNRLWFNQDIDQTIITLAKNKLVSIPQHLTIPYWDIYDSNSYEILESNRFKIKFEQVGMSMKLNQPYSLKNNLTIMLICNEADAKLWADTYPKAFKYRISEKILTSTWKDINYYLAFYKNQPVGTGIIFTDNKISGIHGVGVIPEARRKGFADEIMKYLINESIDSGSEYATLQASNMGKDLYLKLGFEEQFVIKNYTLQHYV